MIRLYAYFTETKDAIVRVYVRANNRREVVKELGCTPNWNDVMCIEENLYQYKTSYECPIFPDVIVEMKKHKHI
jgi:hypothetical protein